MAARLMHGASALVLASGCATSGPEPRVDLMQGCWIARSSAGEVTTLRLLPEGEELAGYESRRDDEPVRFAFARDGSRMTIGEGSWARSFRRDRRAEASAGPGAADMEFVIKRGDDFRDYYSVSVDGQSLTIASVLDIRFEISAYGTTHLFKRDACD